LVVGVGIGNGPVVVSGSGAGSDEGVIAFVIGAAIGRSGVVMMGRLVRAFVPASNPCGGMGGLVERAGSTDEAERDWSSVEGKLVAGMGAFVCAW
jgi:hypothetical protein